MFYMYKSSGQWEFNLYPFQRISEGLFECVDSFLRWLWAKCFLIISGSDFGSMSDLSFKGMAPLIY